jgi:hypothetical protein
MTLSFVAKTLIYCNENKLYNNNLTVAKRSSIHNQVSNRGESVNVLQPNYKMDAIAPV